MKDSNTTIGRRGFLKTGAALSGGLIISFVVIMKLLIHLGHFAPFWEAFAFSVNYAVGFILIVVSAKNTGPFLVIMIYMPATFVTPSCVPIMRKAGLIVSA